MKKRGKAVFLPAALAGLMALCACQDSVNTLENTDRTARPEYVNSRYFSTDSYCRDRIMKRMGVTADEADELISKTDRYRAEYYKYHTGGNYWTNPVNYDLTLNPSRLGWEACVDVIEDALFRKLGVSKPVR